MKKSLILIISIFVFSLTQAQNTTGIGAEIQWYPAGYQFMATGEFGFKDHHAIQAKFGYNLARRQDFSPFNNSENGGGIGGTLGYRYYFGKMTTGFYLGARVDLWGLTIDWEDPKDASITQQSGTTEITVLQPTAEIGYMYAFKDSPLAIGVNAAGGWEINVVTNGLPVGEGRISLLGVRLRYTLSK